MKMIFMTSFLILIELTHEFKFIGDIKLSKYVENLCKTKFDLHLNVILIQNIEYQNFSISKIFQKNSLKSLFDPNSNCLKFTLSNATFKTVISNLKFLISTKFKYLKLQIIFDFSNLNLQNIQFEHILIAQSQLFLNCLYCVPILNIFNQNDLVQKWTFQVFPRLHASFQSVLIEKNFESKNSVIHIRPILNGCYQFPGIFVPKNKSDFDQLKVPFQNCDLQGRILNVAANQVSKYILIQSTFRNLEKVVALLKGY